MNNLDSKKLVLLVLFFILLFLKVDYRFVNTIECCGDDFDYYIHAQTIATDFDLDYSNQLQEDQHIKYNGKIAPKGFIGSGLLAAPFYFLGDYIDKLLDSSGIFNYKIITYSFSSIFYLFLGYKFLLKSLLMINKKLDRLLFFVLFFGSGISYYAFERFSMTHSYEVFSTSLIIFLTTKFFYEQNSNKKNIYIFLIPLSIVIGLLIRWTNYYLILLPFLIYKLINSNGSSLQLIKNKYFWISSLLSLFIFCSFSYLVYGIITFNPQYVYDTNKLGGFFNFNLEFFISNIKNLLIIFFGQEFGLFWISISICVGFFISIFNFLNNKNRVTYFLILLSYLQVIATVLIWKTTASSYGYRYLFSLIPLSIFIIFLNKNYLGNNFYKNILYILSLFGMLSVLFFESTQSVQLSTVPITNSFGMENVRYSNPNYTLGLIDSFGDPNSYLSVASRSFVGAIIIKIFLILFGQSRLVLVLQNIGLPSDNLDFINLLENIETISFFKFVYLLILLILLVNFVFKSSKFKN